MVETTDLCSAIEGEWTHEWFPAFYREAYRQGLIRMYVVTTEPST